MRRAVRAVVQAVRPAWRALGHVPATLLVLAALATAVMYCSNDLLDKDPAAPRGDGQYRPVMARGDGHMHFLITRSLVFDRDLNFDNDLQKFGDPWRQPRTKAGRKLMMQALGPSLVWAPTLAMAHGAALVANLLGANIQTHGYTLFHQRILFATSVIFAWLAIGLGILVAWRVVGGRWGPVLAGISALGGTSLLYYATYMPSYAHAMDAAAGAGFLSYWALTIDETRWRRFIVMGLLLGIAATVRVQQLALGIVVAIELGVLVVRQPIWIAPLLARGAAVLGIAIVLWSPQLYAWKVTYGDWIVTPQGPGYMRYAHPMVMELLFSSRNGWFSTTPIAYLGAIGLLVGIAFGPALGKRVRFVCTGLVAATAIQVYSNAVVFDWWGSASFGQRRLCSMTIVIVVGLAVLLRAAAVLLRRIPPSVRRALAIAGLGYFVAWNAQWTGRLRNAAPAGRDNRPTCCADVPAPLAWLAKPIYRAVGNPFEFPANALFAWRYGVGMRRWDVAAGNYALVPGFMDYWDGSYKRATATWNLTDASGARFLLDGWGKPQRDVKTFRWTTAPRAEALVPLLVDDLHYIDIPLRAQTGPLAVTIRWNDRVVASIALTETWQTVTIETDHTVGENVLAIESETGGVGVGPLKLRLQ